MRMGQKQSCFFTVLTVDHTYDQVLQAQAAQEMISIIAASGDMDVADNLLELNLQDEEEVEDEKEVGNGWSSKSN